MAYNPSGEASSPVTGAGARAKIAISNATLGISYSVSFHVQPIKPPASLASPNDWTYDSGTGGPWAFLTSGGTWAGTEAGIVETMNALLAELKLGYGSQWTLALRALHHWNNSLGRYQRCSPFPTVAGVTGTFGTNPSGATDPTLGNVTALSLPCFLAPSSSNTKVGKALVRLPAWELNAPAKRVRGVTSATGASGIITAHVTSLIGYLAGAATRVVGVNGGQIDNIADVDVAPCPRIARAAGIIS
jgi:hypothetical protein